MAGSVAHRYPTAAAPLEREVLEERVRRSCNAIRQQAGELHAPIALTPILNRLNATYQERDIHAEGLLRKAGDGWRIDVRTSDERTWRRQRFTLAHEIGHILLLNAVDAAANASRPGALSRDAIERICDAAAAELLMPRTVFLADLATLGVGPHGLVSLYDRFRVSWPALLIRIAELLPGVTVTLWRNHARPGRAERRTLRLAEIHRNVDGPWLPTGLTSRYLRPNPFREECPGAAVSTWIGGRWRGRAVAVWLHQLPQRGDPGLPALRRLLHRRPPRPDCDALLFLFPEAGIEAVADRVLTATEDDPQYLPETAPFRPPEPTAPAPRTSDTRRAQEPALTLW